MPQAGAVIANCDAVAEREIGATSRIAMITKLLAAGSVCSSKPPDSGARAHSWATSRWCGHHRWQVRSRAI
jgi:hypothetical protein